MMLNSFGNVYPEDLFAQIVYPLTDQSEDVGDGISYERKFNYTDLGLAF
jgi:hypothetical protein